MRKVLATGLGLLLATGIVLQGLGLADAAGLGAPPILAAVEGGVAPAVALAAQGRVVPPPIEDIEEMCALLIGCPDVALAVPKQDLGECVQYFWSSLSTPEAVKFSIPLRECGLRANSCKELRECALRGAAPDVCKGRGNDKPFSFCDVDGRAVYCYKGKLAQVRDCPRYGEQCAARDGSATCILGPCPAEIPADGTPVCSPNGQKILTCDQSKLVSLDCTAFGLSCVKDQDGKPACAPAATPACARGMSRCDGDDAVGCVGGHEVKVECGKAGMKCAGSATQNVVGACLAPESMDAGSCGGGASKCQGGNVQYCASGKQRSFFCKGLGFSKCAGGAGQVHCAL